jgi:hypothetical protein
MSFNLDPLVAKLQFLADFPFPGYLFICVVLDPPLTATLIEIQGVGRIFGSKGERHIVSLDTTESIKPMVDFAALIILTSLYLEGIGCDWWGASGRNYSGKFGSIKITNGK